MEYNIGADTALASKSTCKFWDLSKFEHSSSVLTIVLKDPEFLDDKTQINQFERETSQFNDLNAGFNSQS